MRCRKCHYRLNDLAEPRCPECGTRFDPDDPSTMLSKRSLRAWCYFVTLVLLMVGLPVIAVFAVFGYGLSGLLIAITPLLMLLAFDWLGRRYVTRQFKD